MLGAPSRCGVHADFHGTYVREPPAYPNSYVPRAGTTLALEGIAVATVVAASLMDFTVVERNCQITPYMGSFSAYFSPTHSNFAGAAGNPLRHQALFTCLSGISRVVGKVVIRYAGGPHWTQSRLKIHPGGRDSTSCTRVWHWVEEHTAGNQRPHPLESGRRTHSRDGEQEVTGCYPITAGAPLCFTWDPVTTKEIQCQIWGI